MNISHYIIEKLIADGSSCLVYSGIDSRDLSDVIIKKINHRTLFQKNKLRREINISRLFDNKLIVKIKDVVTNPKETHIIYPSNSHNWCLDSIHPVLLQHKSHRIMARFLIAILIRLCDAIQIIHDQGVIHRDIKPQNIIMTPESLFIIDFDLAHVTNDSAYEPLRGLVGTPNYLAPEIWKNSQISDYCKTDIYSLGVTAYYLFNEKRMPFDAKTCAEMRKKVLDTHPRPSASGLHDVDTLIMQIIHKNPENRPSVKQIRYSWGQIYDKMAFDTDK